MELQDLDDLDVLDVFKRKCESAGKPPEEMNELVDTFNELINYMESEE